MAFYWRGIFPPKKDQRDIGGRSVERGENFAIVCFKVSKRNQKFGLRSAVIDR
jgi:hypothetical protein